VPAFLCLMPTATDFYNQLRLTILFEFVERDVVLSAYGKMSSLGGF